jgi:serine/threonine protein kinase
MGAVVERGRSQVNHRLGEGGFGVVHEVENSYVIGFRRAMKVINATLAGDPTVQTRFIQEAMVLDRLTHPNVVRCHEFGVLSTL